MNPYLPLIAILSNVRVFSLHHHHLRLPNSLQTSLSLLLHLVFPFIGKPERPAGLRLKALATNRYGLGCRQGSRRRSSGGRSLVVVLVQVVVVVVQVVVLVQGVLRRARSEVVRPGLTSSHQLVRKTRSQTKKGKGKHLRQKVLSQSCSVGELETSRKSNQ